MLNIQDTLTYKTINLLFNESIDWLTTLGQIGKHFVQALKYILTGNISLKKVIEQSARFGFDSLPITLAMVGLSGMIIALQISYEMVKQGAGGYVGALVTITIIREIGPIMGSFAVISMVGSSMTAEVATMKVTEQVDAIKVLGVDPIKYLIAPRILAGFITMPFLIILANMTGIVGGMVTSNIVSGLSIVKYVDSVWQGLSEKDIYVSLLKALVFGGIIALTSTSIGYEAKGGAIDVGRATTKSVVWSFVAVAIIDYIISLMFFN